MDEIHRVPTKQVGRSIAEQSLDGGTDISSRAIRVEDGNDVVAVLYQSAEAHLAFAQRRFGLPLARQVADGYAGPQFPPRLSKDQCRHLGRERLTVPPSHSELSTETPGPGALGQRLGEVGIGRVDHAIPPDPAQLLDRVAEDATGLGVRVEDASVGGAQQYGVEAVREERTIAGLRRLTCLLNPSLL